MTIEQQIVRVRVMLESAAVAWLAANVNTPGGAHEAMCRRDVIRHATNLDGLEAERTKPRPPEKMFPSGTMEGPRDR